MEGRVFRSLSTAIIAILSAALLAGIFLPVYTDEIGWRFQERAGFDGVDKLLSEACGLNTLAAPPWFMMPVRWYSAFFNGAFADPFWIRVSGVIYALAWLGLAVLLIRRVTERGQGRAVVSIVGLGLLALGTMPLVMVWSRPEQPIILAALAALVVAFTDGTGAGRSGATAPLSTSRQAWTRSLAIWALSCVAVSYHAKGLFLLPLMLGCLFFACRGTRAVMPRALAGLGILATTVSAMVYWRNRMACPDDPILAKASSDVNLSGAISHISLLGEARDLLGKMIENIGFVRYITGIGPQIDPLSFWLEYNQISDEASFVWFLALSFAWALALILAGVAAVIVLARGVRQRQLDPRAVLAVIAFGVAMAWAAMQIVINVYEANFVMLLIVLAIILALSSPVPGRLKAWLNVAAVVIGAFALVSPVAIAALYAPSLARAAGQQGHLAAQPFSIGVFGYAKVRGRIEAAAKLCGFEDASRLHAVMVDDVTYLPLMQSTLPQHAFAVVGGWKGRISDPVAYLKSRGSDGMLVSCRYLPEDLRARAKRVGEFCCLGPPNW